MKMRYEIRDFNEEEGKRREGEGDLVYLRNKMKK